GRVELVDQRYGILPHGPRDGADMAARIEITAARSVVILLNTPDDGFRDTSALTDLTNGEPGPAAGRGQRRANAHARLLAPGSDPVRGAYPYRHRGKHRLSGQKTPPVRYETTNAGRAGRHPWRGPDRRGPRRKPRAWPAARHRRGSPPHRGCGRRAGRRCGRRRPRR